MAPPTGLGVGSGAAVDNSSPVTGASFTLSASVAAGQRAVGRFEIVLAAAQVLTATGTITDDDATPSLSVADRSAAEDAGTLAFTVTLSAQSDLARSGGCPAILPARGPAADAAG